jgi:cytochrome c553
MKHESCGERQRIVAGVTVAVALVTGLTLASCNRKESTAEKAAETPVAQQAKAPPSPTDLPEEQLQLAGRSVATTGVTSAGVSPCTSCHGQQGEGNAAAGFPRIAGHPRAYIEQQLNAFADGSRVNPVMQPIAKNLNAEQRHVVAAYYSTLEPPATDAPKASAAARETAMTLSSRGDDKRQIQACANCHGPDGRGEAPRYPPLAGQHANYLVNALNEWRGGSRNTDPSGQMPSIAKALSDSDIQALAQYFASLPPPPPADRRSAPPRSDDDTSATSGPHGDGQTPSGVGSEQGMPVSGATQGEQQTQDQQKKAGAAAGDARDGPAH